MAEDSFPNATEPKATKLWKCSVEYLRDFSFCSSARKQQQMRPDLQNTAKQLKRRRLPAAISVCGPSGHFFFLGKVRTYLIKYFPELSPVN